MQYPINLPGLELLLKLQNEILQEISIDIKRLLLHKREDTETHYSKEDTKEI